MQSTFAFTSEPDGYSMRFRGCDRGEMRESGHRLGKNWSVLSQIVIAELTKKCYNDQMDLLPKIDIPNPSVPPSQPENASAAAKVSGTSMLHSHTVKQIGGAVIGMLVAVGMYFGISAVNKAIIVDTTTPLSQEHADRVRVNDRNVDDAELQTIERRADQVSQMIDAARAGSSTPALSSFTKERLAERLAVIKRYQELQHQQEYVANNTEPVGQRERLDARTAQVAQTKQSDASQNVAAKTTQAASNAGDASTAKRQQAAQAAESAAMTETSESSAPPVEQTAYVAQVVDTQMKPGAPLANSGVMTNVLVAMSLVLCFVVCGMRRRVSE